MSLYTLQAGRCIVRDGDPLATVHGVGHYDPCELDTLARDVVIWANGYHELVAALDKICAAPDGIAVINAIAEARPLVARAWHQGGLK